MNSSFTLDGEWELAYFPECSGMPQSPEELQNWNCSRIPAQVPGNVEFDLGRAVAKIRVLSVVVYKKIQHGRTAGRWIVRIDFRRD